MSSKLHWHVALKLCDFRWSQTISKPHSMWTRAQSGQGVEWPNSLMCMQSGLALRVTDGLRGGRVGGYVGSQWVSRGPISGCLWVTLVLHPQLGSGTPFGTFLQVGWPGTAPQSHCDGQMGGAGRESELVQWKGCGWGVPVRYGAPMIFNVTLFALNWWI